jgi:acyl-coenzyme A synthetase/AMP-(fatty) acid ligase
MPEASRDHDRPFLALAEIATAAAASLAMRPVGLRAGRTVLRAEFLARVDAWQATLAAAPGRRWALLHDDAIEFAAALYGAWHAGKTVFLPADSQPATIQRLAARVDGFAGEFPGGLTPLDDPERPAQPRQALDGLGTKLILFTSGSGGEPVAIEKALHQLQAEISAQQALNGRIWSACPGLVVHASVSPQHIYGLLFVVLWPLAAGCRIATERIGHAEDMAARLGPEPTLLVTSPAHLKRLPDALDWRNARLGIQAVLSSGGPLPAEASAQARACLGHSPIEIFGSSETGGIAWRQRGGGPGDGPADGPVDPARDERWTALPGVRWQIVTDLLSVASPFLPDAQWFLTADRVRAELEGGFSLLGRVDRIVKIEERRISLSAVECELGATPWVAEVRALTLQRGVGLRVAVVLVTTPAGAELLASAGRRGFGEQLRRALNGRMDRVAQPRYWRVVDALPVNSQGKVTVAALEALFDDAAPPVSQWLARSSAAARVALFAEAGHPVFDGHFPQQALVPGVAQLDWAITLAREAFGVAMPVQRLEQLKFQAPILPDTAVVLALEWDVQVSLLRFRIASAGQQHASGRVRFGAADV